MVEPALLRPGNWLHDRPVGCYCVITEVRRDGLRAERFQVSMYKPTQFDLFGIGIIPSNLTLMGFTPGSGGWSERCVKRASGEDVIAEGGKIAMGAVDCVSPASAGGGMHLVVADNNDGTFGWWVNEVYVCSFRYVHDLQNAFEDATGEKLEINMFGAKM